MRSLILFITFCLSLAQASDPEDILRIRKQFGQVEAFAQHAKVDSITIYEGCEIPIYFYQWKEEIIKISSKAFNCDMYEAQTDYYFKNGELFFVFEDGSNANEPNMMTGEHKGWNFYQRRTYFQQGKTIRYLEKNKWGEDKVDMSTVESVDLTNKKESQFLYKNAKYITDSFITELKQQKTKIK